MVWVTVPDYEMVWVIVSTLYDRQRFVIQLFDDWLTDDDDEVELLM